MRRSVAHWNVLSLSLEKKRKENTLIRHSLHILNVFLHIMIFLWLRSLFIYWTVFVFLWFDHATFIKSLNLNRNGFSQRTCLFFVCFLFHFTSFNFECAFHSLLLDAHAVVCNSPLALSINTIYGKVIALLRIHADTTRITKSMRLVIVFCRGIVCTY